MATGKKSFILYCDQKGLWDKLDNEQAGKLIKHIISYVNDDNPEEPDFVTGLAFEPIKQHLKRDLKKWELQHEQRVEAGKRSAEVRKQNAAESNERSTESNERSISSTVNGSVSVSANEKNNGVPPHKLILWIEEHAPRVQKMSKPLTNEEAEKLKTDFSSAIIMEILTSMHNYKPLTKSVSANLTFRKWAKNRETEVKQVFIPTPPKI